MKCAAYLIIQVICCLFFLRIPAAADDWELVEVKDGVEVFESAWEEYSEHQYKGVSVIEQPIEIIAAVLSDNRTAVSGSMAAFIADLGSRATVVESLINMRTVAADPRYAKLAKELKAAIK
jgi:hypothetical protein